MTKEQAIEDRQNNYSGKREQFQQSRSIGCSSVLVSIYLNVLVSWVGTTTIIPNFLANFQTNIIPPTNTIYTTTEEREYTNTHQHPSRCKITDHVLVYEKEPAEIVQEVFLSLSSEKTEESNKKDSTGFSLRADVTVKMVIIMEVQYVGVLVLR